MGGLTVSQWGSYWARPDISSRAAPAGPAVRKFGGILADTQKRSDPRREPERSLSHCETVLNTLQRVALHRRGSALPKIVAKGHGIERINTAVAVDIGLLIAHGRQTGVPEVIGKIYSIQRI